ncbi:MAG: TIGR00289 family protein [Candidatus Woesearchaeota archaeon]|nr:TIGR00289 family protein [Candidatus Woesearchaeota archaeon]
MKVGVLFSGGKDSCLALYKAMKEYEVACLITIKSENPESYMFHVPNIGITKMQAEAIGIPLLEKETKGEKEKELSDLRDAVSLAVERFGIEGLVTGAICSVYQASRIEKICSALSISCINPLWMREQIGILEELLDNNFEVVVSGVFAFPLDREFLGKTIDRKMIAKLKFLQDKYKINPAGEGGEIETTVLNAPFFRKRIEITDSEISYHSNSGVFLIKSAKLSEK